LNKLLTIAALILAFLSQGQVLLPTAESAFEPQHRFNPSFIRSKGIRKITYEIIDKKDFEVAVDKSLTETYEFSGEGLLTRHYYTVIARTIEKQVTMVNRRGRSFVKTYSDFEYDTVSTSYFYSGERLILKRYHDGRSYYESRYFRYDSTGNLTKELRYRETNNATGGPIFVLGSQNLMSEDSFQYTKYSTGQVKSVLLNNENRPYKEKIINSDSAGRTTSISENYTAASWIMQEYRFSYSAGKLASATFEGNASQPLKLVNLYEYDTAGELYGEKHFRNDVLVKEVSYVTERTGGLLNSFVIRDHLNKTMRIVKLKYDLGMVSKSEGKQL
jgi:hypothetical protein